MSYDTIYWDFTGFSWNSWKLLNIVFIIILLLKQDSVKLENQIKSFHIHGVFKREANKQRQIKSWKKSTVKSEVLINNLIMHNVEKWPNILLISCGVHTARFNLLSANPTKWSSTLIGCCRQIVWVGLTILWGRHLKGLVCLAIFQPWKWKG